MENNTGIGQNGYQSTPCREVDFDRFLPIVLGQIFIYGDLFTKLSFLVMGISNIIRGQIIKGVIFLVTEAAFIYFMLMSGEISKGLGGGIYNIKRFITLGDIPASKGEGAWGQIVINDDSRKCLLFGVCTFLIIFAFIALWAESIKSGYEAQCSIARGRKPNSFYRDILVYFDKKIYRTLLFLPLTGIIIFTIMPIIFMICIAFTNFDKDHNGYANLFDWVGFDGFKNVLGLSGNELVSQTFWKVAGWTIIWAICTTFLCYIFGLILAMVINRKGLKFKKFWRTIFVMSVAVPQFVSLLVMRSFLAENGILNGLLETIGLGSLAYDWLGNGLSAKIMVIVINLWVGVPYTMLITTGILMNIPAELYEAAKVDGANTMTTFFKITLPYMIFVTTPYLIQQFIGNINNFGVIFLLTGGAPEAMMYQAGETDLLVTWLYKLTTSAQEYSMASVIGILVFILSAGFSIVTYRQSGSYKNEEEFQ